MSKGHVGFIFYRVRKLTNNAHITYRLGDRLVVRHFSPRTSAILYTIANPTERKHPSGEARTVHEFSRRIGVVESGLAGVFTQRGHSNRPIDYKGPPCC